MNASPPANPTFASSRGWPRLTWTALLGLLACLALLPPASAQGPTAIDVQYFRATLQGSNVLLEWRTGTEIDTGGFQVYRSEVANDPGRGVMLDDFPPQGDTAGYTYQFTDARVEPGMTYYYTLVAYDLYGNESPFPSDPPAITVGDTQPQSTPTFTPTQPAATATPTNVPGLQPVTPGASSPFTVSTPTFTPFPNQATIQPIQPVQPAAPTLPPPAAITPGAFPTVAAGEILATPAPLPQAVAPAPPGPSPAEQRSAAQPAPAATPAVLAQAPAAPSPTLLPPAVLPLRSPRPMPPPAPPVTQPQAILGIIAVGSVLTALLIAGLMVVLWLRWRSGG